MTSSLTKTAGGGFELTLKVAWSEVEAEMKKVKDEVVAETEIAGFRKGKAPADLVEKSIDQGKLYGEVVNRVLPKAYSDAVAEQKLRPISAPSVKIVSAEQGKDWEFLAISSEKPEVLLGDYKDAVKSVTAKGSIIVPGQTQTDDSAKKSQIISDIIKKLLETCKVELSPVLVEQEVSRQMTSLIDDVRAAGLTLDQYLTSKGATSEQLKDQFSKQVETSLKLEFIIEAIADDLKIEVTDQEITEVINKETDPNKAASLRSQSYLLASIMRREKTLTKLSIL